jgi:hypothetical protein
MLFPHQHWQNKPLKKNTDKVKKKLIKRNAIFTMSTGFIGRYTMNNPPKKTN